MPKPTETPSMPRHDGTAVEAGTPVPEEAWSGSGGARPQPRIIVALDVDTPAALDRLVRDLDPTLCRVKVGKELFTAMGPAVLETLHKAGFEVFLDLKYHDIPNTTAQAVRAAARLGVWMVNVHASGGRSMMARCREVLDAERQRPLLIAVTLLTSLSIADAREIGFADMQAGTIVDRLARLARDCGLDGVVCSAGEAAGLRATLGPGFRLVTPGIRPAGSSSDDQVRIYTPSQALAEGSDYLVIGRPITAAPDPVIALQAILDEIRKAGY